MWALPIPRNYNLSEIINQFSTAKLVFIEIPCVLCPTEPAAVEIINHQVPDIAPGAGHIVEGAGVMCSFQDKCDGDFDHFAM
jgi:hypothetical protein